MPFTPFHMGPGLLIKCLLQGSFSLLVFGYTQILMDLQPLIVLITGEGHLHGFSHTFIGATLIAIAAAVTGKYLSELGLKILRIPTPQNGVIYWWVAIISAFIGSYSHVLIDALMHSDLEPFLPFTQNNLFMGLVPIPLLHKLCIYSGLIGAALYFPVQRFLLKYR